MVVRRRRRAFHGALSWRGGARRAPLLSKATAAACAAPASGPHAAEPTPPLGLPGPASEDPPRHTKNPAWRTGPTCSAPALSQ
eukprot:223746-Alexandrium_andersonii.AAC.1